MKIIIQNTLTNILLTLFGLKIQFLSESKTNIFYLISSKSLETGDSKSQVNSNSIKF